MRREGDRLDKADAVETGRVRVYLGSLPSLVWNRGRSGRCSEAGQVARVDYSEVLGGAMVRLRGAGKLDELVVVVMGCVSVGGGEEAPSQ